MNHKAVLMTLLLLLVLPNALFSRSISFFPKHYPKEEIEIGNMVQESLHSWKKQSNREPSFTDKENIMRSGGCSVSYHRCFYKYKYYDFEKIIKNKYPKIDTSKLARRSTSGSKKKKDSIVRGPEAIYVKKTSNSPVQQTTQQEEFAVVKPLLNNKGFTKFGIDGPECYTPASGGTAPCLPETKTKFSKKPFPKLKK